MNWESREWWNVEIGLWRSFVQPEFRFSRFSKAFKWGYLGLTEVGCGNAFSFFWLRHGPSTQTKQSHGFCLNRFNTAFNEGAFGIFWPFLHTATKIHSRMNQKQVVPTQTDCSMHAWELEDDPLPHETVYHRHSEFKRSTLRYAYGTPPLSTSNATACNGSFMLTSNSGNWHTIQMFTYWPPMVETMEKWVWDNEPCKSERTMMTTSRIRCYAALQSCTPLAARRPAPWNPIEFHKADWQTGHANQSSVSRWTMNDTNLI